MNTDSPSHNSAPAGKPVTKVVGGTLEKQSMIATVTNKGQARWMIIDSAFNAHKLIEFLAALIKYAPKKVFLILDNLRVHHSELVKAWAAGHQNQIQLLYLPSYRPVLNPEERLNADLNQAMMSKVSVRTKAKLRSATEDHMTRIGNDPDRAKAYFEDTHVTYTAG